MASKSKEDRLIDLILKSSPYRQWRFTELLKETKITRAALNKWISKYRNIGLLHKVKKLGNFPYYTVGKDNPIYADMKRQVMLSKLFHSGLIRYLSDSHASTIIIFGSAIKGDWYGDSDIDIFMLGDISDIDTVPFEKKLGHDIEIHHFSTGKELDKIRSGLLFNVLDGYLIKGSKNDILPYVK